MVSGLNQVNVRTTEDKIRLVPLGDLHLGSKNCDVKLFRGYVEYIRKTPNTYAIIMGDMLNTELADSAGIIYEDVLTPEEEYELIYELLLPIKNKIIGIHMGNHEARIYRDTSIDLSKRLAKDLDCRYLGDAGFTRICVTGARGAKQTYVVYSEHGAGNSISAGGKINALMKAGECVIADVILMGHLHDVMNHATVKYYVDAKDRT